MGTVGIIGTRGAILIVTTEAIVTQIFRITGTTGNRDYRDSREYRGYKDYSMRCSARARYKPPGLDLSLQA